MSTYLLERFEIEGPIRGQDYNGNNDKKSNISIYIIKDKENDITVKVPARMIRYFDFEAVGGCKVINQLDDLSLFINQLQVFIMAYRFYGPTPQAHFQDPVYE